MEQENKFSVAVHYGDALGYIEYDGDAKRAAMALMRKAGSSLQAQSLETAMCRHLISP